MIYKGKYDELSPNHGFDSMKDHFSEKPHEGQDKIVQYLRQCTEDMFSMRIPKDVFTGETIKGGMIGYNDGKYSWWSTLAYYVEKYNLRLPKEFEEHILSKGAANGPGCI